MNRVFARIGKRIGWDFDEIVEIVHEITNIDDEWPPEFIAATTEITDLDPQPEVGWVYENGDFSPPSPYVPTTPVGEMSQGISDGCEVRSTETPSLNAKYFADGPIWQRMTSEVLYIVSFNKFSGGLTQVEWPTKDEPVLFTDKNDFKNVVQAIGDWLTGWNVYIVGNSDTPPTDFVTID